MTGQQSRPDLVIEAAQAFRGARTIVSNADSWWHDCAQRALTWLADGGFAFSVDDLVDLGVPEPDVPGRWGAVIAVAARAGTIEFVGYTVGRRGGIVRLWRGTPKDDAQGQGNDQ